MLRLGARCGSSLTTHVCVPCSPSELFLPALVLVRRDKISPNVVVQCICIVVSLGIWIDVVGGGERAWLIGVLELVEVGTGGLSTPGARSARALVRRPCPGTPPHAWTILPNLAEVLIVP